MTDLLILSCSQRKRHDAPLMPAIERYDGPRYRMLRRHIRTRPEADIDVFVLSAEYGLFPGSLSIANYDRVLTYDRALELRPSTSRLAHSLVSGGHYTRVYIDGGRLYELALDIEHFPRPPRVSVEIGTGSQGARLSQLQVWLNRKTGDQRPGYAPSPSRDVPRLRGVEITLTPEQVLDVAERGVDQDPEGASRYYTWYVNVHGRRVGAKWLVSRLTGLEPSEFISTEACRLLGDLGIEVRRV